MSDSDSFDDVGPPHDDDAESALLACAFSDPTLTLKWAKGLSADDFYEPTNRSLWLALLSAHAEHGPLLDHVLLVGWLRDHHLIDAVGGSEKLQRLTLLGADARPIVASEYATRIVDFAAKRGLIQTAGRLREIGLNGASREEVLDEARREVEYLHDAYKKPDETWKILDGDALAAQPATTVDQLWPGLVALDHLLLLAGTSKTGKSWLLYAFLGALSRGEPWLGLPARAPITAVIVSEEPPPRVQAKLVRFGVRGAVVIARDGPPSNAKWTDIVARAGQEAQRTGAQIVLFDTLSGLAGIEDENAASEGNAVMRPLLRLAPEAHVAVIVTHHSPNALRRGNQNGRITRAIDFVRGTGSLTANPDAIAGLDNDKDPDGPRRILVAEGRFDTPPVRLLIEYVGPSTDAPATFKAVGRPGEVEKDQREQEAINKIVRHQQAVLNRLVREAPGGLTAKELQEALGAGNWVRQALPALVDSKRVRAEVEPGRGGSFRYFHIGPEPTLSLGSGTASTSPGG